MLRDSRVVNKVIFIGITFIFFGCQSSMKEESTLNTVSSAGPQIQCITSVPIPDVVTFAGDTIPIDREDVKESLEAELMINTFRHSHTLRTIKNVERWRPLVTEILLRNNIPADFLYLAVIESEFDNNARSFAGAVGMWQLMEETAKEYKLKINSDVDMRRDPKLSTEAACKYLQKAYGSLNNWTLAAASYNVGVKGVKNRLEEQKVSNYFDLHLNSETGRYVYRILAMKLILENPKAYGYFVEDQEKYKPFKFSIDTVRASIQNLVDYAKEKKCTYKELRTLNPWFNNTSSFTLKMNKGDFYEIRIPQRMDSVSNYSKTFLQ